MANGTWHMTPKCAHNTDGRFQSGDFHVTLGATAGHLSGWHQLIVPLAAAHTSQL